MQDCNEMLSFETMLRSINRKWTILAVVAIANSGRVRFNELRRLLTGISPKTLIETLRNLENLGIVTSDKMISSRPRMEYRLTEDGKNFQYAIMPLLKWMANKDRTTVDTIIREAIQDSNNNQ